MNYFELHIGDLTEATSHLSILEDGVYGRLMRKYYATEKPLPADLKVVQRLIGARSKEEREAVANILSEFFELQDDGWHQSRCDAEIAAYHEKMAGKEGAKEGAKERQRRARERRKALFEQLRGHGQVPAYTTTTVELEVMLSRVTGALPQRVVTHPVTRDDTATQTPSTRHQTPDTNTEEGERAKRATRKAPPSFAVTPDLREWAGVKAPGVNVDDETEKFRDHTFKTAITDWPGAWRNWIRNCRPTPMKPALRAAAPAPEPEWRTVQRERMQQAAPYAIAKPRTNPQTTIQTEDDFDAIPLLRPAS